MTSAKPEPGALHGRGLHKRFDEVHALRGVDISVQRGAIPLLIGPSGGGKTTLLRCLAALEQPDAGSVLLDGTVIAGPAGSLPMPPPLPWPRLTVVFQQQFLWPHLTLRQNILLPLRGRLRDELATVDELEDLLSMKGFLDRYPNEVSAGQRQRAAVARALALQPDYLLLDEITASLDVEQSYAILQHLLALRGRGLGMLLITHSMGFAREVLASDPANQAVFLADGEILERGGVDLILSPRHERLRIFLAMLERV